MAAAGYAAFAVAMMIARVAGDSLALRLGPAKLVRIDSSLAAAGLTVTILAENVIVGFAAVGAGYATIIPQVFSAAGRTKGTTSGIAVATASTLGFLLKHSQE